MFSYNENVKYSFKLLRRSSKIYEGGAFSTPITNKFVNHYKEY